MVTDTGHASTGPGKTRGFKNRSINCMTCSKRGGDTFEEELAGVRAERRTIGTDVFLDNRQHYNHTGFMINLPTGDDGGVKVDDVIKILDRGGTHYTLGMRGYYLAIPLALWLFGPLWLLSGTLLLIATLYWLDRGI